MKWVVVAPEHSSLQNLVDSAQPVEGSRVPAKFIEFLLAKKDDVILLMPTDAQRPAQANGSPPNLRWIRAPLRPSWRRVLNGPYLHRTLSQIIKEERPDVLYAMGYSALPCSLLARCWGIPCFSRVYGTFLTQLFDPASLVSRRLPKLLAELAVIKSYKNGLILSDDGTQGDVVCRRFRVNSDGLLFPRNGVNKAFLNDVRLSTDVPETRRKFGLKETDFVITNVSRLASWKRVDLVISAFDAISGLTEEQSQRLVLLIVGSGKVSQEEKLRRLASSSSRAGRIRFLGNIDQSATMDLMRSSDVVTSFYEVSNVGNVLLEALHLGCVVVARDTGATSTIIKDRENGFLVPEEDRSAIRAFGAAISDLMLQEGLAARLSNNALRWAAENIIDWKDRFQLEYDWIRGRL